MPGLPVTRREVLSGLAWERYFLTQILMSTNGSPVMKGEEPMRRSHLRRTGRVILLISALFVLAACGSGTPLSAPSASAPHATPRPTTPVVPSHLVHFSTSDRVQLAGLLFGHGKTAVVCSHEIGRAHV